VPAGIGELSLKTYEYRGYDEGAHAVRGLIEAASLKEGRERLAARGILAERLDAAGSVRGMRIEQRALFYRELGVLLIAGMPLVRALELLMESAELKRQGSLIADIRDRVQDGASLASALTEARSGMSPFETAVIEAGEQAATLSEMLERLAVFLDSQERTKQRIQSALIYPLIVSAAAVCAAILMLGVLIPRARAMWESSGAPLPGLTRMVITVGDVGMIGLPALIGVGILVVVGLRRRLRHDHNARVQVDRLRFSLPLVGEGSRLLALQRFARTLAILLQSGMGLLQAMRLAGKATGSPWIVSLVETEADGVEQGASLSDAMRRIPPFSDGLTGWVRIGEESGELARLLETAGRRYEDVWERFVSRRLALLEPCLIFVIGAFVMLVALAVLLPILGMSEAI